MGEEATILHADADSFYASVEQRDDPSLRGKPVIVGGGVVLAASYEAKAFGVYTPMGETQARRLCPQAIVVRPRMEAYSEASDAMFDVFRDTTPLVEGLSIDEAFLDVGGLWRISGTPDEIAARLRAQVRERVGIPVTVGVARTKFLAKVASGVAKPDGLLVVPVDDELGVPAPPAGRAALGRRAVTSKKLRERSLTTVADVARARRGRADRDPRPRVGPPPARAGAQPRPTAGRGRPAASLDRHPASARPARAIARPARRRPDRARRPARAAPAQRAPGHPDGDAPPAVRRPHPGDPLAHAPRVHDTYGDVVDRRPRLCSPTRSR